MSIFVLASEQNTRAWLVSTSILRCQARQRGVLFSSQSRLCSFVRKSYSLSTLLVLRYCRTLYLLAPRPSQIELVVGDHCAVEVV
jgi:hypothetical protein